MLFVFNKVLIFRSTDISLTSEIEIQLFVRSQHVHFPFLFSRSEFITSSPAKRACITWTASGLSHMQNAMRHTVISRKVVGKMCTRQSRKAIWDMINTMFLTTTPVEPTFVAFLEHFQTHFHGLLYQFFQISLKNSELKTTHNVFRDCRVQFFRQPFSK